MAKKSKQVNNKEKEEKLTINNISAGDVITDSTRNSKEWNVDDDLIEQMRRYEQESNKTAIWKNKITGMFLFFKYYEDNPEEKKKAKKRGRKPKKVEEEEELTDEEELEDIDFGKLEDEAIESEVVDEDDLLLDAMEDYKAEFGVKKVNINTKKFKTFFEEWKQAE